MMSVWDIALERSCRSLSFLRPPHISMHRYIRMKVFHQPPGCNRCALRNWWDFARSEFATIGGGDIVTCSSSSEMIVTTVVVDVHQCGEGSAVIAWVSFPLRWNCCNRCSQ